MKARGAAIQGGLAVLGLALTYTTWQQPAEQSTGDVVVVDANKNDVSKIRYEDEKNWVEVSRAPGGDAAVWVRLSPKADAKQPEREVRGNEAAERLFSSFAPLKATRTLGVVSDVAKLKEYGLDASKRKIEVTTRGDKRAFLVGTPSGSFAPYLKDERDGHVYLLGGSLLSDLESASSRMVDRSFHGFKPGEFDALVVAAGGKSRDFVVTNLEQPNNAKLAPKATPDKPDETARNWHDKLWRLYAMDVLGKGEKPAAGEPQIALRVDYSLKGKPEGFVEIGKVTAAAPAPAPVAAARDGGVAPTAPAPPPVVEVYARSERTAGWVKIGGNGEDLIKEGLKLATVE